MKDNVTITFRDMNPDEGLIEIARADCAAMDHRTSGSNTWTVRVRRRRETTRVCVSLVDSPEGFAASAVHPDPREALVQALHGIWKSLARPQTKKAQPFLRRWDTNREYLKLPA